MRRLMAVIVPDCSSISRTLSDSFERKLSLRERWQLRLHLLACVFCRRYRRQLQVMKRVTAAMDESAREDDAQAPSLSPEARERIRKALPPEYGP